MLFLVSMPLTEQQFVEMLSLISNEAEAAFIIVYSYEELNRLALTDKCIFKVLNDDPTFWSGYRSTMLTALFMTMSRLFDPVSGASTVEKLVTSTLANLDLFSTEALRARKMVGHREKPFWLDDYMSNAWSPQNAGELRHLKKALRPHVVRFGEVYLPIRNNVYAHRFMTDEVAGSKLFPSTNRDELGETLDFLRGLIDAIYNLFYNGLEPLLGKIDLTEGRRNARLSVEKVLRKLVAVSSLS